KRTNAREDFDPWQKEPRRGRDCAKDVTITDKIDEEIRNNQDRDRAGLLRKRTLKTAERDREDPHPEQDEQLKEHQGLIWCSVRNFSSWSVSKFASTWSPATKVGT